MTAARTSPSGIRIEGWGWRYPERIGWALRDVDLVIEPGERVAIVGPSGSGKSTLLRAITGVLTDEPDPEDETAAAMEGSLLVDGVDPRGVRGRIGLVMQDPEAHTVMSRIGDDVAFGCENLGVAREDIWERVRSALEVVGLDLPLDRSTGMLSGGQRQRLALAGILAMRPGAIVLDEPCANLDPDGVRQVREAVGALVDSTGATLVVVEHRIGTWLDLIDRLVLLKAGGGVVADGRPDEVIASHRAEMIAAGVWLPDTVIPLGFARARTPMASDPLLSARGLGIARSRRVPVAAGIDCAVRPSRVLAVTGPNGVGKSTLGLTMSGLLPVADGTLAASETLANGSGSEPYRWSSRTLASRIGTVFQNPEHAFVARSVRDELLVGPTAIGIPAGEAADRADAAMDAFGLTALAEANPYTLSGGEQRRLAIAAATTARPAIVVLDEPTSGQDVTTWRSVVEHLGDLADDGTAIVAITHDRELITALAADELALSGRSASGVPA